jgi:ssDNA-binding Zn-finger/Zn-ribbon topoisomerase 1
VTVSSDRKHYYADCPKCGERGALVSHDFRKRTTLFKCVACPCLYGTLVARNGLRLNTKVLA